MRRVGFNPNFTFAQYNGLFVDLNASIQRGLGATAGLVSFGVSAAPTGL